MSYPPIPGSNWFLRAKNPSPDWINVLLYGADPTGIADSTPAFQAAVNVALTAGGTVYIPKGIYKQSGNVKGNMTVPVSVVGDGWGLTVINFTGSGDAWRLYCSTLFAGSNFLDATCSGGYFGGAGITINGTGHTGTGASGLHIGDLYRWTVNVQPENFTASGDIGVHLDNTWFWSEQWTVRVQANECAIPLMFDRNPDPDSTDCTGSFDGTGVESVFNYSADNAGFNGPVFNNGAYIEGGPGVYWAGTMQSSASSLGITACLSFLGSAPVGAIDYPRYSHMSGVPWIMAMECEGSEVNTPYTVYLEAGSDNLDPTAGTCIYNTFGSLTFASNPANFTNCNDIDAVDYWGPVVNDTINTTIQKFAGLNGGMGTTDIYYNQIHSDLSGGGTISQGSGVPSKPNGQNPVAGDIYFRTDTPSTGSQRIYICTTGGGSPVWAGIA